MHDLRRLRRAGGDAIRVLVDLLPEELDPRSGTEDVAIIFADISGYSAFVAEAGDDAAIAVLRVLDGLVSDVVCGRGRVVKRLGDGLMVVARRSPSALRIGVDLVEGFDTAAESRGWPLRLRAGVHRGTCRRQGEDYFGYHVNLAARVADAAPAGAVRATANVLAGVDLARVGFSVAPGGPLEAKGVTGRVELFEVSSAAQWARRKVRRSDRGQAHGAA